MVIWQGLLRVANMLLFDSQIFDGVQITGGWLRAPDRVLDYQGIAYLPTDLGPGFVYIQPSSPSWSDGYEKQRESLERLRKRGAITVVLDTLPEDIPEGLAVFVCPDTTLALAELATVARSRAQSPLVCVTGSVGKSTTKRGVAALLSLLGATHESQRNFNHYQGVLLSLAAIPSGTAYSVLEFSSDLPRFTLPKAMIAAPDLAVVTDIQFDHTDCYPSLAAIADQKSLLFRGLRPGGKVVLNRDSPYFSRLAAAAYAYGACEVISFGTSPMADLSLVGWSPEAEGSAVEAVHRGRRIAYQLGIPGKHNVLNSLAMLSVLVALGLDPQPCLPALAELASLPRHCSLQSIDLPGGQIHILDDSFSSNPASLRSALETLALLTVPGSGVLSGRRLLVLGAIDELGERSEELHVSLAEPIMRFGIDRVYAYGDQARHTCAALPASTVALHTLSAAELRDALLADLRPEDWLILKFSRHSNLGERLWPALRSLSTGPT